MTLLRDHKGRFLPANPDSFDPRFWPDDIPYRPIWLDDRGEHFALVDARDYEAFSSYRWSLHSDGRGKVYARRIETREGRRHRIYLHREVMARVCPPPSPAHFLVDHMDGNGLDCRRHMIRWATPSENRQNLHGFYWKQLSLLKENAA